MQIFTKDFAKEWAEYPFNPVALASIAITKESLFCNAITNAQCERNLKCGRLSAPFLLPLPVVYTDDTDRSLQCITYGSSLFTEHYNVASEHSTVSVGFTAQIFVGRKLKVNISKTACLIRNWIHL